VLPSTSAQWVFGGEADFSSCFAATFLIRVAVKRDDGAVSVAVAASLQAWLSLLVSELG
jgi:hypothetical protein